MTTPPLRETFARLIASAGSGPGGRVLAGQTDTVPCDPGLWRSDPCAATERDGRLYGLGTTDTKGFLALAVVEPTLALLRGLAERFCVAPAA